MGAQLTLPNDRTGEVKLITMNKEHTVLFQNKTGNMVRRRQHRLDNMKHADRKYITTRTEGQGETDYNSQPINNNPKLHMIFKI